VRPQGQGDGRTPIASEQGGYVVVGGGMHKPAWLQAKPAGQVLKQRGAVSYHAPLPFPPMPVSGLCAALSCLALYLVVTVAEVLTGNSENLLNIGVYWVGLQ
jgi:hypothetical protein